MALIDVSEWTAEHVVAWIRGVHESLKDANLNKLIEKNIDGNSLMNYDGYELSEELHIGIDETVALFEALDDLQYLSTEASSETLQSLILKVGCKAHFLYNHLTRDEPSPVIMPSSSKAATPMTSSFSMGDANKTRFNFHHDDTNVQLTKIDSSMHLNSATYSKPGQQRVSLQSFDFVSDIAETIKYIVYWLDSREFTDAKLNREVRSIILRIAVELTSTAQRDQFVDYANDKLKLTCKFLADYCDYIVLCLSDVDYVQACRLDIIHLKKKSDQKDFGIYIHKPHNWFHSIKEVVFSSAAHISGKISKNDELLQVDYQTVVGWSIESIESLLNEYQTEVTLTLRKKPGLDSQRCINATVIKPFPIPLKLSSTHLLDQADKISSNSDGRKSQELDKTESAKQIESDNYNSPQQKAKYLGEIGEQRHEVYIKRSAYTSSKHQSEKKSAFIDNLKRSASISGIVTKALVDLALGDALPIPTANYKDEQSCKEKKASKNSNRVSKDSLTKSISHDTAKLYLHTLSIDKKHLW